MQKATWGDDSPREQQPTFGTPVVRWDAEGIQGRAAEDNVFTARTHRTGSSAPEALGAHSTHMETPTPQTMSNILW